MSSTLIVAPDASGGTLVASPPGPLSPPQPPSPGQSFGATSTAPTVIGMCPVTAASLGGKMATALAVEGRLIGNPVLIVPPVGGPGGPFVGAAGTISAIGRMKYVARMVSASP